MQDLVGGISDALTVEAWIKTTSTATQGIVERYNSYGVGSVNGGYALRLEGDGGDFVGALLEGGEVTVTGNAGNYAGIGMRSGHLRIGYSSGKHTGEGMRGGTIRVQGRIASLGRVQRGTVYEGSQRAFPAEP